MNIKLFAALPIIALAIVIIVVAPRDAHAAPIYEVSQTYVGGYLFEFAFSFEDGVATADVNSFEFSDSVGPWAFSIGPTTSSVIFDGTSVSSFYFSSMKFRSGDERETRDVSSVRVAILDFPTGATAEYAGLKRTVTSVESAAVPEPATLSLIALGVAALVLLRRRAKLQLEHPIPHGTTAANA